MFGGIKHTLCAVLLVGLSLSMVSGQEVQSNHPIRLVVGKQPGSRKDMVRRAAPTSRPPGFLDRLMSFGRGAGGDSNDHEKVTPLPDADREPADWTGVPYHQPGQRSAHTSQRSGGVAPMVDPGAANRTATTRSRAAAATTGQTRSSVGPVPTPPSADTLHVPSAKGQVIEVGSEPDEFSATFSSRRNSRRDIDPLDAELLSASDLKVPTHSQGSATEVGNRPIDLSDVPRVQQRTLGKRPEAVAASPAQSPAKQSLANPPTTNRRTVGQPTASQSTAPLAVTKPSESSPATASVSNPPSLTAGQPSSSAIVAKPSPSPETLRAPQALQPPATLQAPATASPQLAAVKPTPPAPAATAAPSTAAASQTQPNMALQSPPPQNRVATRPSPGYPSSLDAGGVPAPKSISQPSDPRPMSLNPSVAATPIGSGIAMPSQVGQIPAAQELSAQPDERVQTEGRIKLHATAGAQPIAGSDQMSARDSLSTDGKITSVPAEVPGLRVIAEGPSQIMIRQITQYEIRVENRGAVEAPGVLVRTAIPQWIGVRGNTATRGNVELEQDSGARQLLWKIDSLPAGAIERLTLQVQAEKSGSFGVAVDWTLLPQKNKLMVNVREPKLQLLIEGPDQVVFGESETYKVRVLNPGDGTAANVMFTLSPNSATPQTQKIGGIPPGKEAQFEVELTAQDLGDLKIHGLATGDLELRTEGTKTIRVAAAELEAMLTGPPLRYQNGEATYKLKIQNRGIATTRNVVAKLQLPVGIEYVGGVQGIEVSGDTLRWTIDQLESGAVRDYAFRCKMSNTGAHLLAFECQGTAAGRAAVSLTTRVEALADLVLTINDPPAPAPIGEDVIYELVIANRGSKAASDVRALTHFSDHIEPTGVEGHTGKITVGQVLLDPIPRIDPGQSVTIRITAQANLEGHHRFRAEINCGETVLVAEEATRYMSPMNEQISRRSSEATNW